jgi:glycosyltransferase involved in cell wall biosynthesis
MSDVLIVPGIRAWNYWITVLTTLRQKLRIIRFYTAQLTIDRHVYDLAKQLRTEIGQKVVVLYVGRLTKQKGCEVLIDAFAKLRREYNNVLLIVGGEGKERQTLEKLCKKYNISHDVVFPGALVGKLKTAYYLIADIIVRPSIFLKVPEEYGVVVVEAISMGKPVIVTDTTGVAYDIVKNWVNGFVVPEKSADALYRALKILVTNNKLRAEMGFASKKIFEENFNLNTIVDSFKKIIYGLATRDL